MSDKNSVLNNGLGSEPINFVAACLLFKSPWWAKAPEEAKHILRRRTVEINVFLDLTKLPPVGTLNRIGERCHSSIVIGFSHKVRRYGKRFRNEGKLPGVRSRKGGDKLAFGLGLHRENTGLEALWYLLFADGTVQTIRSKTLNKWQKLGREEWVEKYWTPDTSPESGRFILGKTIHPSAVR